MNRLTFGSLSRSGMGVARMSSVRGVKSQSKIPSLVVPLKSLQRRLIFAGEGSGVAWVYLLVVM